MLLREIFPIAEVSNRIIEPVTISELGLADIDLVCAHKTIAMRDIGASIGYRAKVLDPLIDLNQFADAFDEGDPWLFQYIEQYLGETTLHDVYAVDVLLSDQSLDYRTVAELVVAAAYPNVLHIASVEFSNPRRPIPPAQQIRAGTRYKGLGLFALLVENCVAFAHDRGLSGICLTPSAHDLVPLFTSHGFAPDDNEFAELMRAAGSAGPMTLPVVQNAG
jgi:hypothetical protein